MIKWPSRSRASASSWGCTRPQNSSITVAQNRSVFPTVCGWCVRATTCWIPSFRSSFWKSPLPRQAKYCRPWSVSTSFGFPNRSIPLSRASTTKSCFCWSARPHDTMYRLKSSRNTVRYTRWPWRGRTKLVMSLCHSSPATDLSKRLGRAGFCLFRFVPPRGYPLPLSAFLTVPVETLTPTIRPRKSFTFLNPKVGLSRFTSSITPRSPVKTGRPGFKQRLSKPFGPTSRYICTHFFNGPRPTPQVLEKSDRSIPDF